MEEGSRDLIRSHDRLRKVRRLGRGCRALRIYISWELVACCCSRNKSEATSIPAMVMHCRHHPARAGGDANTRPEGVVRFTAHPGGLLNAPVEQIACALAGRARGVSITSIRRHCAPLQSRKLGLRFCD